MTKSERAKLVQIKHELDKAFDLAKLSYDLYHVTSAHRLVNELYHELEDKGKVGG